MSSMRNDATTSAPCTGLPPCEIRTRNVFGTAALFGATSKAIV
jgi:hypothetical protein